MASKCVGIDIGSYSIKVAEIDAANTRSYSIKDFFVIPIGLQNAQDERIKLLEALQKIARHFDLNRTRVVVGLRQEDVTLRRREFPFKERYQLLKALPFELEDEIPLDPDDAIFDAKVIGTHANNTDVLAAACLFERVQDMIDLLGEAGIEPDIVTVDSFGLANNFEAWNELPKERAVSLDVAPASTEFALESSISPAPGMPPAQAVVYIGHTRTLVCIIWDGNLITARSLFFGGSDFIQAIQARYGVPEPEAQKIFQERAFVLTTHEGASHDQIVFSDTISDVLKRFVSNVKLSILEIESELKVRVQNVGLLGGASHILNLAPYLTAQLALPTNLTKPLKRHPRIEFEVSEEVERSGAIAIGLALEGFRRPRNPAVNFRKGELAKTNEILKQVIAKWKHAAMLVACLYVAFTVYAVFRDSFATQLDETTQDRIKAMAKKPPYNLAGSRGSLSGIEKFVKQKKREFSDQKILAQLKTLRSPLDVLKDISGVLPDRNHVQLDITHFGVEDELITLEGDVASTQQADALLNALQTLATDKIQSTHRVATPGKTGVSYKFHVARVTQGSGS